MAVRATSQCRLRCGPQELPELCQLASQWLQTFVVSVYLKLLSTVTRHHSINYNLSNTRLRGAAYDICVKLLILGLEIFLDISSQSPRRHGHQRDSNILAALLHGDTPSARLYNPYHVPRMPPEPQDTARAPSIIISAAPGSREQPITCVLSFCSINYNLSSSRLLGVAFDIFFKLFVSCCDLKPATNQAGASIFRFSDLRQFIANSINYNLSSSRLPEAPQTIYIELLCIFVNQRVARLKRSGYYSHKTAHPQCPNYATEQQGASNPLQDQFPLIIGYISEAPRQAQAAMNQQAELYFEVEIKYVQRDSRQNWMPNTSRTRHYFEIWATPARCNKVIVRLNEVDMTIKSSNEPLLRWSLVETRPDKEIVKDESLWYTQAERSLAQELGVDTTQPQVRLVEIDGTITIRVPPYSAKEYNVYGCHELVEPVVFNFKAIWDMPRIAILFRDVETRALKNMGVTDNVSLILEARTLKPRRYGTQIMDLVSRFDSK
ncbi:hypothetical protein B0H13DRAFT_1863231 [Mycena leptocephala]|nr:hypothetical protein B0H13DRAFT_1863231 [Mycena leptocephala]